MGAFLEENKTVTHSNALINAVFDLTINEMRLVAYASTKIGKYSKIDDVITITVKEFRDIFNLDKSYSYKILVDSVRGLIRKPIVILNKDKKKVDEFSWLEKNSYHVGGEDSDLSEIEIKFSRGIEGYLFALEKYFTILDFEKVSKLNNVFAFRLYQWLSENKYKKTENGTHNLILSIDEMKERAKIEGYKTWADFRKRIIEPAIDKINEVTELSVIYTPQKKGKAVHSLIFTYVDNKGVKINKPTRERLKRRPKCAVGSALEGEWMRTNYKIIKEYEQTLKEYDPNEQLPISDLEKLVTYSKVIDPNFEYNQYKKELEERRGKK